MCGRPGGRRRVSWAPPCFLAGLIFHLYKKAVKLHRRFSDYTLKIWKVFLRVDSAHSVQQKWLFKNVFGFQVSWSFIKNITWEHCELAISEMLWFWLRNQMIRAEIIPIWVTMIIVQLRLLSRWFGFGICCGKSSCLWIQRSNSMKWHKIWPEKRWSGPGN